MKYQDIINKLTKKELRYYKNDYGIQIKRFETTLDFDEWLEYKFRNAVIYKYDKKHDNMLKEMAENETSMIMKIDKQEQ